MQVLFCSAHDVVEFVAEPETIPRVGEHVRYYNEPPEYGLPGKSTLYRVKRVVHRYEKSEYGPAQPEPRCVYCYVQKVREPQAKPKRPKR